MRRLFFVFLLGISLFPFQQVKSLSASSIKTYLVNNGLANSTVWCGMQDQWGFMWFGTGNGLNRFDGYEFRTFKEVSSYGKENMDIHAICKENDTIWWIGHEKGVSLFDVRKESFSPFLPAKMKARVQKIIKDEKNGLVWIATRGQGLFRYEEKTGKIVNIKKPSDIVWDLALDGEGNLYAATHQKGLACFNKAGKLVSVYSNSRNGKNYISDNDVKSLFYEKNILWAGTWKGGLNRIDLKTGETVSFLSAETFSYIPHLRVITPYTNGEFLLGTDEGVYVFNPQNKSVRSWDEGQLHKLSDRAVHSITVDRSGGIWVGTIIGGLNYQPLLRKKVESCTPLMNGMGFSGKIVTAFQEDREGNLWIATEDGGLNYFNPKQKNTKVFLPQKEKNSLSYHNLRSLCLDGDDLWIGTFSKGVDRLNLKTGKFTNYHNVKGDVTSLSDNSAYVLFKHSKGDLYIGTVWGLNRYVPSTDCFVRISDIDEGTQIQDMLEDEQGNLWLATYHNGIYCYLYAQKRWVHYLSKGGKSGLPSDVVVCLYKDRENRIWVGTSGGGLCSFDKKSTMFRPYTECEELKTATICSIEGDSSGNLWMGSDKGLLRLNPRYPESLQIFTQEDGFQGSQYYYNSVLKTRDGKLYFGGINGFSSFYPSEIKTNPNKPEVQITSFLLYNKPVTMAEGVTLPQNIVFMDTLELSYQQNMIGFSFSALNYENPEKNGYAYRLEGVDEDWVYTNNHTVSYANLQPGRYLFKVKAANNDGLWSNHERNLMIIVHPPFWKSLSAYLLYTLFFLLLIFFFLRGWYLRIQRKNSLKIEHLHQEKEKEMYEQKLTFFTQVAHDIRTPLSLIKGPLEQILKSDRNKEFTEKMLKTMDKNINYLVNLVDQLLLFRKVETKSMDLTLETCEVKSVLADICERFQVDAELRGISFTLELPDSPVYAELDRFAFDKVVSNLVFNALKFTKDSICVQLSVCDPYLELRVSDNGAGIPLSISEQVFVPFYSRGSKNGTGIGLSLVKQLVEGHDGTVRIEESETEGACFLVQIPFSSEKEKSGVGLSDDLKDPDSGSKQIIDEVDSGNFNLLVVEDNTELRNFIVMLLEDHYTVHQAKDGEDAISVLNSEVIHLVVSDVMMPRMNGFELCAYVKQDKALCYIPFIMLTAKTSEEAYIQGLEIGADAYISKPFSGKRLLIQIRNLLQSRLILCQGYWSTPFSKTDQVALNKQDQLFIEELNKKIDEKLADEAIDFSIDILASELGMSRSVLYRRIKGTFNLSPNDYLKNHKLKRAADLLRDGIRINEVADRLGFSSSSYFARCFKEQFGVTPKEFLQENKKGNR